MSEAQTGHEEYQQHEKLGRAPADQHAPAVAQDHDEGVPDEVFDALMDRAQTLMAYEKQMPALLARTGSGARRGDHLLVPAGPERDGNRAG